MGCGNNLEGSLGVFSGILALMGYGYYNWKVVRSEAQPSVVTWLLWSLMYIINAISFHQIGDGEWLKLILPFANVLACLATLGHVILKEGAENWPDRWDIGVFLLAVFASFAWWWSSQAMHGNALIQIAFAVSFLPTLRSVWRNPRSEDWVPWAMWSVAYAFLVLAVFLRWHSWSEMVYPVNCLVLNGAVGYLCTRR